MCLFNSIIHAFFHPPAPQTIPNSSEQGLCVATLFCFFNGEVIAQVKRKYRTLFFSSRARSNSYTATQVSVSIDFY